jgi:cation diffusion facilitator family transporter
MDLARSARRIAVLGMLASAALAVAKILVGLAAHSVAVVSDGIESTGDVLTSGLVYIGLRVAAKPADAEHPYGHGRFELLMGLGVGLMLMLGGVEICWRSLEGRADQHSPALFALWPLGASIIIKAALATAKMRIGRRAGSGALIADAWHDSVDLLSGFVALAAVLLSAFGAPAADHWGGFAIGLVVLFLAQRTIRETTLQLMDTMPDAAQMNQIRATALEIPGALGVDKCFARKTGLRYHVDLHLEVDPELTVMASHEIAHAVKNHLIARLTWVEDVLVHVEPYLGQAQRRFSSNANG